MMTSTCRFLCVSLVSAMVACLAVSRAGAERAFQCVPGTPYITRWQCGHSLIMGVTRIH